MRILGIDTTAALIAQWAAWLAPERQPFVLADHELPEFKGPRLSDADLDQHTHDMYALWDVKKSLRVHWLDEDTFNALPRATRTALVRAQRGNRRGEVPAVRDWRDLVPEAAGQAGGHRFVWWPSMLAGREVDVLSRWVSDDMLPSRHAEVPAEVWREAKHLLPNAEKLAGSWVTRTGPNCFGTVMAAAGVDGGGRLDAARAVRGVPDRSYAPRPGRRAARHRTDLAQSRRSRPARSRHARRGVRTPEAVAGLVLTA